MSVLSPALKKKLFNQLFGGGPEIFAHALAIKIRKITDESVLFDAAIVDERGEEMLKLNELPLLAKDGETLSIMDIHKVFNITVER